MNIRHLVLGTTLSFMAAMAFADDNATRTDVGLLNGVKQYSSASLRSNEIVVAVPSGYSPQLQTLAADKMLLMMAMFRSSESPSNWSEELKITTFVGSGAEFIEPSDIDGYLSVFANRARSYCKDDFFVQFEKSPKFDRLFVQGCKKLDRAPDQSIYEFSAVTLKNRELVMVSRVIRSKSPLDSPLSIDDPRVTEIRAEVDGITLCDKNVLCVPRAGTGRP